MFTIEQIIIMVILYVSIMGVVIKVLSQRDKKIKLKRYEIDLNYSPIISVEQQLDTLIDNIFAEYKLYYLEYRDEDYIKEIEEQEIIKTLSNTVLERISPTFLTQLSTYFNIDSLGTIIATKISLRVNEYRISKNMIK